jgi:hypothetical protein
MVSTPDFAVKEISMTTMQDKAVDSAGISYMHLYIDKFIHMLMYIHILKKY